MIKLLEQAIEQNLLRPLDLRFAQMLVAKSYPTVYFCLSQCSNRGGSCLLTVKYHTTR